MKGVSRTACFVAAGRAIGAREADPDVRNPDYLAEKFLGDPAEIDLDLSVIRALGLSYVDAMQDIEVANTVRAMAVRTRFIDDALRRAVDSGAEQLLILGAGFDSHAYRFQDELQEVSVFEVDRAATQSFKRERVNEVLGGPPANLTYVAVDFQRENLRDVLVRHGYDFARRSIVLMEGLTMYLSEDAVRETFELAAAHPPGSVVVFDFVSKSLVTLMQNIDVARLPARARQSMEEFMQLTRDEPWEFGFPSGEEREYLDVFGLEVKEILTIGGKDAARRFLTRADGTELGGEALSLMREPPVEMTQMQRDAVAYRIAEVVVAYRH